MNSKQTVYELCHLSVYSVTLDGKGTLGNTGPFERRTWTWKQDSLEYFNPDPAQTDEEQQQNERLQRNRQDIMQAEGLVSLLLKLIDKAGFQISAFSWLAD